MTAITPLEQWISEKTGIDGRPEPLPLRAYQFQMLRKTLRHARQHSRHYRTALDSIDIDAIADVADLSRLPFTAPADIAADPNAFLCVSPREVERIVTLSTSGTTGNPKRVFFTQDDQELTADFFHRGMETLVDQTDCVIVFMPGQTPGSVGALLSDGLGRIGCKTIIYGPIRDYADALDTMIREKVTSLVGIPSQILTLSRYNPSRHGALSLRTALLSADYVPEAAVKSIEKAWGIRVFEHYGMTETGLGGAVACSAHDGYHMRDADLLFEIVDPITGEPLPDGQCGEVIFTTLTRRGMPLIRYKTGDRARILTEPCPCGTVLRRLGRVMGRIHETVALGGGKTLSIAALDEAILPDTSVSAYTAVLTKDSDRDKLTVTIRCDAQPTDLGALETSLRTALPDLFGPELLLDVRVGDAAFFTTGTLKRQIADHRNP